MATVTFAVHGMTCEHCVRAVQGAATGVDGVDGADVDLATGTAQVHGPAFETAAVIAAIGDEGYGATLDESPVP